MMMLGICWVVFGVTLINSHQGAVPPITIQWQTETEYQTAGFNIYRSRLVNGDYEQINPQLIPSAADPSSGATYTFQDTNVEPGINYFYKLEDVEYSNERTTHPPFDHKVSMLEAYGVTFLAYFGLLIGILLFTYGSIVFWRSRSPNPVPTKRVM